MNTLERVADIFRSHGFTVEPDWSHFNVRYQYRIVAHLHSEALFVSLHFPSLHESYNTMEQQNIDFTDKNYERRIIHAIDRIVKSYDDVVREDKINDIRKYFDNKRGFQLDKNLFEAELYEYDRSV